MADTTARTLQLLELLPLPIQGLTGAQRSRVAEVIAELGLE